jgi:hypothetical protein
MCLEFSFLSLLLLTSIFVDSSSRLILAFHPMWFSTRCGFLPNVVLFVVEGWLPHHAAALDLLTSLHGSSATACLPTTSVGVSVRLKFFVTSRLSTSACSFGLPTSTLATLRVSSCAALNWSAISSWTWLAKLAAKLATAYFATALRMAGRLP